LKRILLLSVYLFAFLSAYSLGSDKYWVGGTGNWSEPAHWSESSGGSGGASVPGINDNVHFDRHSFSSQGQEVTISDSSFCHNFHWSEADVVPTLSSSGKHPVLTVFGSFNLPAQNKISFFYRGNLCFGASGTEEIDFHGSRFEGEQLILDGPGEWILKNDINATWKALFQIKRGTLRTQDFNLCFGDYIGYGRGKGGLKLGKSNITVLRNWDVSETSSFHIESDNAGIFFKDSIIAIKFKPKSYRFHQIDHTAGNCTPSADPCPFFTITLTKVDVVCNGDCNGSVSAVITGGTGPFTYAWSPGSCTSASCSGLCANTYIVAVTDNLGNTCFCSVPVGAPPALLGATSFTPPSCNGGCNATVSATESGGTGPYSWSWTPGLQTTATIVGQCAGTYTVVITDSHGCQVTKVRTVIPPPAIVPNGSSVNVTCFGFCNGTATVAPTGGTGAYTYSWSPGSQTTPGIIGLCPGNYTCTIHDANNCVATYVTTITQPAAPLAAVPSSTNNPLLCNGNCNATATATVSGGTAPYTYSWSPGSQTTPTITALCAGTYTCHVTDANGCIISTTVTITQPNPLTVTVNVVNLLCNGICTGSATANVLGGTAPYTYSWSPVVNTTCCLSNLCAGTYSVTVTDAHGCTATGSGTITQPPGLTLTMSSLNVTCFGACNGSALGTPSGGTGAYTYSWSPGSQTTPSISGLCPGTYTLTVHDANGCSAQQTITITQPTQLLPNATSTNQSCAATCDGTATASPTGGVGPYTYSWNPTGNTTCCMTNLCAGIYTVTVHDANGCVRTQVVTIIAPNVLSVTINTTPISCFGGCNGSAAATVTGGTAPFTYSWSTGPTTPTISPLCAGTYTVTVTDANGCTTSQAVTLINPPLLTLLANTVPASCSGQCNGSACAVAGGGTAPYTYSWAPGGQTTACISSLCVGSYTVTLTDANGCTQNQVVNVTAPTAVVPNVSQVNVTCAGNCNGSATATPSGGTGAYTYSWAPGGQTTPTISALCAGTYTVTVTDAHGCTGNQVITITQPLVLNATLSATTSTCGNCTGTATVSVSGGAGSPYTYSWNPSGQTNPTATNLCIGQYTCTVTDPNGCTSTVIANIVQTVNISITSAGNTLTCFGSCNGIASANASGGAAPYTYSWNPTAQTTQNATGLCAGTYTVTATDANGCFNTSTVTFTNPPRIQPTLTVTNPSCNSICNGTASLAVIGGTGAYTYSWQPGGQTTSSIAGLCVGTYTFTVTDANGCDSIRVFTINQPTAIVVNPTVTPPSNCIACDGSITAAPSGGTGPYTYSWSPGAMTTATINNLCAGLYTVTVTDSHGCTTTLAIPVSSPSGPTLIMSQTNASCNGSCNGTASVAASGGAPPYLFNWSPPPGAGQGTNSVTGLCAGVYHVRVTDVTGCIVFGTVTITQPAPLTITAVVNNVTCGGGNDGNITVTPAGGTPAYTYTWLPGNQTTPGIAGLSPGNYTVTVKDVNGCQVTNIYTITQPVPVTLTVNTVNVSCNALCNGSATTVVAGGTTPYTYTWSSGQISSNVTNLCAGAYTVTVTDAHGCSQTQNFTITEPPVLTSSVVSANASCNGVCDGSATVTAAGGTPVYSFLWAPGSQITATISGLCAGAYSVTSTDSHGCTSISNITITEPPAVNVTIASVNATCNGSCNGDATANATGGTGAYTYSWSPGAMTTQTVNGLCAGNYTVTVTDANNCLGSQIVTITQPSLMLSNTSGVNPTCAGTCNGSVTANPIGGTAPYTYSWTTGPTTQNLINLCQGSYTVQTTDANGCTDIQTVTITDPAPISSTNAVAGANCGVCNGTISITPVGGTAPYTYTWAPAPGAGQGTPNVSGLCAGLYVVTVKDVNGCSSNLTIPVNNTNGPTNATVTTVPPTCYHLCNGSATITAVTGGTPAYTYSWADSLAVSLGNTTNTASGLCAGGYFIQITDAAGCIFNEPLDLPSPMPFVPHATLTQTTCSGLCTGAISLSPTGGTGAYTYSWSNALPPVANQTNLCGGTYTVQIKDANGCDSLFTFTISPMTVLQGTLTIVNPTCGSPCSGSASIAMTSGTAPYTYAWSDPFGQTTATATNLCAGTYTVTITDANGCNIQKVATLLPANNIAANPGFVNPTCGVCNGTATLTPTGGTAPYTYAWSTGATTASVNNLCAGVYSVNISDANGCTSTFVYPISSASGPGPSTLTVTNITCNGICNGAATATGNGGTAPYAYSWLPGGQVTNAIAAQCAGLYFVEVTDANGCRQVDSVNITQPPPFATNQLLTQTGCGLCNGGISLNPSGGTPPYTYAWSNALPPVAVQSSLCAGTYTVSITDASGCSHTYTFAINSSNGPVLTTVSTNITCSNLCNGTATVNPVGGGPFTYTWSPAPGSGQGTANATAMCPGSYTITVANGAGCVSSSLVNITHTSPLALSAANVVNVLCSGQCNGVITAIPFGGTLPYTYSWTPGGQTTATISNLCIGTYTVNVTDANGCTDQEVVNIIQPSAMAFTNTFVNPPCDNVATGSITITPVGGTAPFTYSWVGPGVFTSTLQNLVNIISGTYTLTVTDAKGCQQTIPVTLVPGTALEANAGNNQTFCNTGAVVLNGALSTNATTYAWYQMPGFIPIGNTVSVTVTPATGTTVYELVVANGGCTDSSTVNVTSNPPPIVEAGPDQTIITNASVTIGGNPTCATGVTFHWSPSAGVNDTSKTNPTVAPLSTTQYIVTVVDANGCVGSDTMTVIVLPQIVFPNGISPNGDGANDIWIIDNISLFPNNVVEIYNRWGELLYQAKGYQNNWDGTYNGKPLPVGTYYYIIDLHDSRYTEKYTGPITIMR
jgi:gliding motility-associated-like protein